MKISRTVGKEGEEEEMVISTINSQTDRPRQPSGDVISNACLHDWNISIDQFFFPSSNQPVGGGRVVPAPPAFSTKLITARGKLTFSSFHSPTPPPPPSFGLTKSTSLCVCVCVSPFSILSGVKPLSSIWLSYLFISPSTPPAHRPFHLTHPFFFAVI